MKKTLLSLIVLFITTIAFAERVEIDGIYYNLNNENKTAEVTSGSNKYSGNIIIPSSVTYNSETYSVTSIGVWAFEDCSSLTSITIPNSVTSIGNSAFRDCSSLTSITIPNSVTSIGNYAFDETPWLNNQPDGCIYINNLLYTYKGEMPANTHINVKEGTTQIYDNAFNSCSSLTSITIPNSVTSIGEYAFYYCSSLTSITIPNSVTEIGEYAFYYCSSLTSITIPNSVTEIGKYAFYRCSSLTSITIPNSVTSISSNAFGICSSLTSITIPNSVTSISSNAFIFCSSLTSINVDENNTNYASIEGVLYDKNITTFICCPATKTNITIPNSVTSIGNSAFQSCISLTSITIPNSVTSIGEYAFYYCSSLTSITIGAGVTEIGEVAFGGTTVHSLSKITFLGSIPPNRPNSNLDIHPINTTLIVPHIAYNTYKEHTYWCQFFNIETIDVDYKTITAIANNSDWGSVEGGDYYDNGKEATLTAIPNNGYRFVKWDDEVMDNPRTVVVTQDSTFTAIFEPNTITITTAVNDEDMGSVTEGGEYAYGAEITLTATANTGYRFAQWSDGNTDNPRTITVTENKTYTAEFELNTYTLIAHSYSPNMGGVKITLTAEPIKGFEFVGWSDGSTENPYEFYITENTELYAYFQIAQGGNPVDLETSKISSANIYTQNGTLHIEGATENYHILDAAGRLIYSGNTSTLSLPRGIYLVTINGETQKIAL